MNSSFYFHLAEYEDEISSLDKLEWGFAGRSVFIRAVYRSKYSLSLLSLAYKSLYRPNAKMAAN